MSETRWLTIIGIGDNGLSSLTPSARLHFDQADAIIAPERVLESLPADALSGKEVIAWTTRIHETVRALAKRRGEKVTILATGDPFHFGIAATLSRTIPADEMTVIPHSSGFSLAASRLGWPLQDADCISLHGRAVTKLNLFIEPDNRIIALTSNGETIAEAVDILVKRGFERSKCNVLEHIGGAGERIVSFLADEMPEGPFADFNMLAINCKAGGTPVIQPRVPGLPDDGFVHDGQLTKREVRAATLAALAPYPSAILWDVGAGCGSVAIEFMRAARGARAVAFERDTARLAMIAENASNLATPTLSIVEGDAKDSMEQNDLPPPDAVFIGGGLTGDGLFERAYEHLRPRGILVANTVTLEGEAKIIALHSKHGGDLVRIDVSHLTKVGRLRGLEPRMSVLQWRMSKP